MVGTESWNRNLAQKNYVPYASGLEKLFGRRRKWSQRAMVPLSNGFWEGEMVFAVDIDMLKTERS
jgi:hypothetical protein